MGHDREKPVQGTPQPASNGAAPAQAGHAGLLKTLKGLDYQGGRAALSPPDEPQVTVTRPGDAHERDADQRAGSLGGGLHGARLHTGGEADQATRAMGAKALTQGQDVLLRSDVTPGTPEGDAVVAHEVAHTLQQGAGGRVAGWWDDGHKSITYNVGKQMPEVIGEEAVDYVAKKAGALDRSFQSAITNFKQYLGVSGEMKEGFLQEMEEGRENDLDKEREAHGVHVPKPETPKQQPKKKGAWKNPEKALERPKPSVEQAQRRWDHLDFHVRLPNEMPLHGEAGAYVSDGGVDRNKAAVDELVAQAAGAFNKASGHGIGNYREGLNRLSDACHANEDRGSHGEGKPWTGHDPRLQFPKQPNGKPNPNYRPGWDCDDVSKNTGGRALAEGYARDVFNDFAGRLTTDKKAKLKEGKGGGESRGVGMRNIGAWSARKFNKFKKLEDVQTVVESDQEYERIKRDNPSPTNPNSGAMENMDRFVAGGGLVKDMQGRLSAIRGEVSGKNVGELEKAHLKYSRVAEAADALAHYARKMMTDEHGMVDEKGHPNQVAVVHAALAAAQRFRVLARDAVKKMKKNEASSLSTQVYMACKEHGGALVDAARVLWPDVAPQGGGEQQQAPQEQQQPQQRPQQQPQQRPQQPLSPLAKAREQARLEAILILRELKAGVHTPVQMEKGKDKYQYFTKFLDRLVDYRKAAVDNADDHDRASAMCGTVQGWLNTINGPKKGHKTLLEDCLRGVERFLDAVEGR